VLKLVVVCPTPDRIAENIAANNEGSKKWKITLFESITPFSLIFLLKRVCEREQMNPTAKPIAVAAPGL
jgi:hypothetical protein